MTHVYMFVGMPVFALDYSILPIAAAVVGGPGTLAGAAVGAFILVPLSELLRGIGAFGSCFTGCFWWSASLRCRKAFFTISGENISSSNAGSRWTHEIRRHPEGCRSF